jgi:signal transduction histidine kinase
MRKNPLFNKTRLQIAAWYATGTGTILILVSFYIYFTVRDNYWSAINRETSSLGGTLHDALEPKLQEPGVISEGVDREILPNLCVKGKNCNVNNNPQRHVLGVTQQDVYYLRFYNLQGQIIAQSGNQPVGEILPRFEKSFYSIDDVAGQHYHRYSTGLTTTDGRPWGFLQVGRSMKEFDERLANLQHRMALVLPVLMLFIAVVSWLVAGRTMKPIYSSYAKMQQFTADAAHELRTPLMALQATVDLMQYYEPTEYAQQKESLAALDRQTERLIQLAQDLLMLSRLDAPMDQAPVESCCLNQVVPALVKNLQALSQEAGINLNVDLTTAESLLVKIDRIHLERLLTNLVGNAIEHTLANGTVTVTVSRSRNQAVLQVIDTGIGISPEVQAKIFDRFYRATADRSWPKQSYWGRQSGGAGLGLAIVKSIVNNYGGIVLVKSQLQKGSTFIVKLPLCNLKPKHYLT